VARVTAITSKGNALLARWRRLASDPGGYRKSGEVLLEGEHLCTAWRLRGQAAPQAVVSESAWAMPGLRELASSAAEVAVVSDAVMAGLGTLDSPAAIAFLVRAPEAAAPRPCEPTLVLDRVQDPGNVGSMLRSAAAFGFTQVIALAGTAALWSPKVVRAGMGAHFGLHLCEGADGSSLAVLEVPLFGTSPRASAGVDTVDLPWPCGWVLGHEGQGIAPSVAARCAALLSIPQPGGEESLNVAAAAAVCLYESARRRRATGDTS
jgi:TrmH family RNA methyltransferase